MLLIMGFMIVHLTAEKLRFLGGIPRSRWLSMAGGVSVSYVFIHIFPDLVAAQSTIAESWKSIAVIENHAYVVALFGLIVFYGLERLVKSSRQEAQRAQGKDSKAMANMGIFWLHMASFAIYNALIGYLLVHREEQNTRGLFVYFVAMALHFLVNDYGLREDHQDVYKRIGRWILSAAIFIGWVLGVATKVSEPVVSVLFAFLAGGIVLNVLKEELPEERQSRFSAFVWGAAVYSLVLLFL